MQTLCTASKNQGSHSDNPRSKTLGKAFEWLTETVSKLYFESKILSLADLRACLPDYKPRPKYGYTPEDLENYKAKCDTDTAKWKSHPEKEFEASSKETLKQQTRMAFEVWTVWDVEVICDYPDNLFYGNGRGDQNGTAVDVPNDTGSKEKVKAGAMSLYEALEGKLTIVNKHGNPSIDKMVSED